MGIFLRLILLTMLFVALEGKMMGRGGGGGRRRGHSRWGPWWKIGRRYDEKSRCLFGICRDSEDDDIAWNQQMKHAEANRIKNGRPQPCVGICYYMKMQKAKQKAKEVEAKEEEEEDEGQLLGQATKTVPKKIVEKSSGKRRTKARINARY